MKKYESPMLSVIEMNISESIAALVPKTVYKKRPNITNFDSTYTNGSDIQELESYATSNQTV